MAWCPICVQTWLSLTYVEKPIVCIMSYADNYKTKCWLTICLFYRCCSNSSDVLLQKFPRVLGPIFRHWCSPWDYWHQVVQLLAQIPLVQVFLYWLCCLLVPRLVVYFIMLKWLAGLWLNQYCWLCYDT